MADPVINALSLCSGYAGLDIGFEAACEHLGIAARTVAYVEWEAYAAALLIRRMEAQCLAPAPVWCGDLGRLNGDDFRGRVDAVLAGFPCQPHSHAGSRKGVEDERWIWPDIVRIVRESGAWLVVLENVAGLLSSGGFAPVLTDLAEMGFDVEWGVLSAGSVGASHRRERVFIVAYRHNGLREWQRANRCESAAGTDGRGHDRGRCAAVANTSGAQGRRPGAGREPVGRSAACGPVDAVDHPASPRCIATRIGPEADSGSGECVPGAGFDELAHAARSGRHEGQHEQQGQQRITAPDEHVVALADADGAGQRAGGITERHGDAAQERERMADASRAHSEGGGAQL